MGVATPLHHTHGIRSQIYWKLTLNVPGTVVHSHCAFPVTLCALGMHSTKISPSRLDRLVQQTDQKNHLKQENRNWRSPAHRGKSKEARMERRWWKCEGAKL